MLSIGQTFATLKSYTYTCFCCLACIMQDLWTETDSDVSIEWPISNDRVRAPNNIYLWLLHFSSCAALVLLSNAANIANILNLVSYLRNEMHMDVARASTMASNFFAALQMFSIPAAFLADSYIKRFYTVLIFGPVEIVVQLATQTFSPKLYTSFFFC